MPDGYGIVVVGTSWGGLQALRTLVGGLPADFCIPVVIVQHRHRDSDGVMASLLQDGSALRVSEVEDKQPLLAGHVFVAPPDYHLLVEDDALALSTDAPVRYSRPSIDVLFTSASDAYGVRAIGVVLTGANADGAAGLRHIVSRGGLGIVQDPREAVSPAMPTAAADAVPEAAVLPLTGIVDMLRRLHAAVPGSEAARELLRPRWRRSLRNRPAAGAPDAEPREQP